MSSLADRHVFFPTSVRIAARVVAMCGAQKRELTKGKTRMAAALTEEENICQMEKRLIRERNGSVV